MMMNSRKWKRKTTKKEGNQEDNLRENINSERKEQSVKSQHRDQSKIVSVVNPFKKWLNFILTDNLSQLFSFFGALYWA